MNHKKVFLQTFNLTDIFVFGNYFTNLSILKIYLYFCHCQILKFLYFVRQTSGNFCYDKLIFYHFG